MHGFLARKDHRFSADGKGSKDSDDQVVKFRRDCPVGRCRGGSPQWDNRSHIKVKVKFSILVVGAFFTAANGIIVKCWVVAVISRVDALQEAVKQFRILFLLLFFVCSSLRLTLRPRCSTKAIVMIEMVRHSFLDEAVKKY